MGSEDADDQCLPEFRLYRIFAVGTGRNQEQAIRLRHRNLMITAFIVSICFLACYLTYHEVLYRFTSYRGRAFEGSVLATRVYFGILIPHVILAALVPILALRVFYLAFRERWSEHRRLAKITLPVWLFVSITGVVIYGMLYHWPWPNVPASLRMAQ